MPRRSTPERPDALPLDRLRYDLDASLVRLLTWVHRAAGTVAGIRLSPFGQRRLEVDAHRRRILHTVVRSGQHAVSLDEVARVQAGALLAPRRRVAQDRIRRAVVLCDAARHYGSRGQVTTADDFATYVTTLSTPAESGSTAQYRRLAALEVPSGCSPGSVE